MIVVARASVRISLHSIKERGGVSGELGRQDRHAPDRCVDPVCEERSAAFSRHARLGLVVPAVFHCKRARDLGALALVPCSVTLQGWDVEIADQWRRFVAVRFARDSLLEEAVLSELVSEAKFPASWENTGNFIRLGLRVRLLARNPRPNSRAYNPIPYASEQGIYFGLAGN
jgi:hypothetical protein